MQDILMYILIVLMAGILSSILCVYAFLKIKNAPGVKYYILVTLFSAIFTFAYAFELSSTTLEKMKLWLAVEYLVLPFIPLFILYMCIEYAGLKMKGWMYYVPYVLPILTIFMHNTNDLHHLYYKSIGLREGSPFPVLQLEGGLWFYVHSIFMFLCLMISIILLLMQLKKSLFRFRMQILLMVAGIVAPIIANHFYLNGLSPHGIDLGPVSMSISFIFHGVALLTFQMFHVAPIARDRVFESMAEGVIVLNPEGVIVDYNKAMRKVIPDLEHGVIGKPIEKVLNADQSLLEIIKKGNKGDHEMYLNGERNHFSIQFSSVHHTNNILLGQIITFVDMTERVLLQEKLKHLASIDGLTQLYNRTYFLSEAEKVLQTLHQEGGNVAVIMFDIDYFKVVNDTFGHVAGDHILSHVASVAKACLRESDLIGRYGGEEFIICLPNTTVKEAHELANLIRLKVSKSTGIVNNKKISVTSSFGISSCFINVGDNRNVMNKLMKQADQALYIAKNNGRNCVQVYKEAI